MSMTLEAFHKVHNKNLPTNEHPSYWKCPKQEMPMTLEAFHKVHNPQMSVHHIGNAQNKKCPWHWKHFTKYIIKTYPQMSIHHIGNTQKQEMSMTLEAFHKVHNKNLPTNEHPSYWKCPKTRNVHDIGSISQSTKVPSFIQKFIHSKLTKVHSYKSSSSSFIVPPSSEIENSPSSNSSRETSEVTTFLTLEVALFIISVETLLRLGLSFVLLSSITKLLHLVTLFKP